MPGLSPIAALVRRHDRDRYVTALFAPPDRRAALFALYAFNYEIARVRETVSEPLLGAIRLQWWRDALAAVAAGGKPPAHEVAAPLARAMRDFGLDAARFGRLLDAREIDLATDPPADLTALEGYAAASGGELSALALDILGTPEAREVGRHVGAGYALAGLLRAAAFHARARRSFIPRSLDPERSVLNLKPTPELARAAKAIADAAREQLDTARTLRRLASRDAIPALLPAVIAEHWLRVLESAGYNLFSPRLGRPDPWRGWRLWRAARGSRYWR